VTYVGKIYGFKWCSHIASKKLQNYLQVLEIDQFVTGESTVEPWTITKTIPENTIIVFTRQDLDDY
jgi:hypothetical protein